MKCPFYGGFTEELQYMLLKLHCMGITIVYNYHPYWLILHAINKGGICLLILWLKQQLEGAYQTIDHSSGIMTIL